MDLMLQIWGGGFYLLNKIFFVFAEGKSPTIKRQLRLFGWVIYILGVPAWVIILISKHNWIAASMEVGGVPAMIFGLYNAYHDVIHPRKALDLITSTITYMTLIFGVSYSFYDYGGIYSLTQFLEIGTTAGFLIGSYLLAKKNSKGWLFFMLMNGCMAALMFLHHKPLLAIQQLISLCFVIYGFSAARKSQIYIQ
jgi:hypothetical protein